MRKCGVGLAILLWACWASQAQAAITYQYVIADPSSFGNLTNLTAAPGATVTANVYLQETVTGSDTSVIAAESGLFGASFFVTKSGTTGDTSITSIAGNTVASPNGFDGNTAGSVNAAKTSAQFAEALGNAATAGPSGTTTGGHVASGVTDVFLGTITFTAGSANSTTTYTLESFKTGGVSSGDGNTITFPSGFDLDANGPNGGSTQTWTGADAVTYSFTVTATPEPSSVVLCGLPAFGMILSLGYARFRRRKAPPTEVAAAA